MKKFISLLCAFCIIYSVLAEETEKSPDTDKPDEGLKIYEGFKTYDVVVDNSAKVDLINKYDGVKGYDFWKRPADGSAKLMVSPENQSTFEQTMKDNDIKYTVANSDVSQDIIGDVASRRSPLPENEILNYQFDYFPNHQEMNQYMKNIVKDKKYSRAIKIGETYESRSIYGVILQKSEDKPVILIDAGIHAREWGSHVSALYIIKKMVETEEQIVNHFTVIIIPCVNPDGYEFSRDHDRLWRKSRAQSNDSECNGVDLNRNFDSHWGEIRADKNPCSDNYAGTDPFSEPESSALRDVILSYRPKVYLTIHSYGPLILYPYGYAKYLPQNWRALHSIGRKIAAKIKKVRGTDYVVGSSARILYEASGGSDDWAMDQGVPIVYTMELPEYNKGSFILPKTAILPLVKETYQGFKTLVELAIKAI